MTDIKSALEPTGETRPQRVAAEYEAIDGAADVRRVRLTISGFLSMSASVVISGTNTNTTHGFIVTTKNRLDAEVARQDESGWQAPLPVEQVSASVEQASAKGRSEQPLPVTPPLSARQRAWHYVSTNPLAATTVGGLGSGLVVAIIVFILNR
ncbi:hypothetical protein [Tsukamurella strandjordii]|uniref:Uncharacterized protein n=1 Tax=Tsukamurella strandjordii TaxID=147577 RepID=A0AA90NBM1_9ACTN|nr:hypothetical protein [Tsukamurella strandjordii]MDP0398748.1 hypothetical protein [Tsukamurella strandjordii]